MTAKDLRNPLKVARGLGSSQSGVGHWWTQRVTAAALVVLLIWFVITVLSLMHADYATALTMAKPWNAVLLIALIITMFKHAVLGLQVVIEDYVTTRWKESPFAGADQVPRGSRRACERAGRAAHALTH
jgi:succinate dehydrogenase / fumarate reductase membrane anchor subunit